MMVRLQQSFELKPVDQYIVNKKHSSLDLNLFRESYFTTKFHKNSFPGQNIMELKNIFHSDIEHAGIEEMQKRAEANGFPKEYQQPPPDLVRHFSGTSSTPLSSTTSTVDPLIIEFTAHVRPHLGKAKK